MINVPEPAQQLFASGKDWGDHPGGWSKTIGGSTSACVGQPAFARRMRTRRPRTAPRLSNENPALGSDEASASFGKLSRTVKSCCWPSWSPSRTQSGRSTVELEDSFSQNCQSRETLDSRAYASAVAKYANPILNISSLSSPQVARREQGLSDAMMLNCQETGSCRSEAEDRNSSLSASAAEERPRTRPRNQSSSKKKATRSSTTSANAFAFLAQRRASWSWRGICPAALIMIRV